MPVKNVAEYLESVPPDQRAALEDLRAMIKDAAPDAVEAISYQVPAFKHRGRPLVSFGAAKNHCAFYLMSPTVVEAHAAALRVSTQAKAPSVSSPTGLCPQISWRSSSKPASPRSRAPDPRPAGGTLSLRPRSS